MLQWTWNTIVAFACDLCNTDQLSIGDDIEPIEAPRADVEMVNDEDEDSLEAEVPRIRKNPKNLTSREK